MGKNSKSNEKNTWMNSVALAPFLLLCAFSNSSVLSPKKSSEFLPILQCMLLQIFSFSPIYILTP